MAIPNNFIFFLIIITNLYADPANGDCLFPACGKNSLSLRFPFWSQDQNASNCGLPGFNLSCNSQQRAKLNIPNSGDFYVSSIYYNIRIITLNDPNNCLAQRLLTLNLSSSPFKAASYINYTFYTCPKAQVSSMNVIDCLSNSSTVVLATKNQLDLTRLYNRCEKIVSLPIPVSKYDYGLPSSYELPVNLKLTWTACPYCGSATGASNQKSVFRTIALAFVIPAAVIPLLIVCISCCICMMRNDSRQTGGSGETSSPSTLALSSSVTMGLDETTIETYEKVIVGESRHISGPNDGTCAICLAEYVPKDTLRFMPRCEHCFHTECIDKWLSINSKCPICRTSQPHTHPC